MMLWSVAGSLIGGVVAYVIVEQDGTVIGASAIGAVLCLVVVIIAYAFAPLDD